MELLVQAQARVHLLETRMELLGPRTPAGDLDGAPGAGTGPRAPVGDPDGAPGAGSGPCAPAGDLDRAPGGLVLLLETRMELLVQAHGPVYLLETWMELLVQAQARVQLLETRMELLVQAMDPVHLLETGVWSPASTQGSWRQGHVRVSVRPQTSESGCPMSGPAAGTSSEWLPSMCMVPRASPLLSGTSGHPEHWSSVTLQRLRPGSVYTVQLQPLGADVAARPQGCPALHSCQRHIVPIGPQLQCKALTESASLGLPRSLCSECSCQSWVISILNGLPRSLCGKGTCQSWVTMETPHGLPRSLCSWGFCQSYVTMETPRGLPRSLCSKRSYQSCVICVPNRLPRSLCGRGSCQSVHSSNSYTQDCHTHEHACANLATYVCTHMAATRRSGVTTFDGEAAERPQGHNL
ncbi:uncharacterized protein [Oryctolagus cuniculus]|uniref:uncharacterized protein isoform X5 n=1 Tax=Oryctolagus cuniculus TaxID=9986 RepID=UPI00387910F7